MKKPILNKEYRVIFGNIKTHRTPQGTQFASVVKMTNCMMLPAGLLDVIPKQVLKPGISYVIPELFEGEVKY